MSPMIAVLTLCAAFVAAEADAKEPAEITIHIRGEHKAVISALLAAADEGTTRTGIAELDSLAATYGLMGIERKGRSSGFYDGYHFRGRARTGRSTRMRRSSDVYDGARFRLMFPPGADGAAMAGAYRNLSYIQSVESVGSLTVKARHRPFDIENRRLRLLAKVGAGTASGIAFTALSIPVQDAIVEPSGGENADYYRGLEFLFVGTAIGCTVGFPLGVSLVDPYDSLPKTLLAGVIPGAVGFSYLLLNQDNAGIEAFFFLYVAPSIGSLIVSEKSRQPPQARRVSFALSPTLNGGLSAVAQLRF